MKIIAATSSEKLLVEIDVSTLRTITNWKYGGRYTLTENFRSGDEIDVRKEFRDAQKLVESFRGIAPGLRQAQKYLGTLADSVELHEPDYSLLPKESA